MLFLGLGAGTFIAGVIVLGFVAFSIFDSGDGGPEPPLVFLTPTPSPTEGATPRVTRSSTTTPTPTPIPTPPLGDSPYRMVIDKIGVDNPVQVFGLDEDASPEVPTGENAAQVVAWYNFSAQPGVGSNAVFAGHVTWFGPGVFYSLTSVAVGDQIKLIGADGTELLYEVSEVFQVDPNDPNSLQVMRGTDEDVITIITCDGAFSDTDDPVFGGEYSHRLVVRGALQSVTPAAAVASQ
jgi:LPXTG-site transpeptidase (sortase) family protein